MCLQWIRYFLQHQLSLVWGAFYLPLLFKDRKIINKASTNGSQGSQEEGLQKDIKWSLNGNIDEEDHEQDYFRVWNTMQVLLSPSGQCLAFHLEKDTKSHFQPLLFSDCLPQSITLSRKPLLIICSFFTQQRFIPILSLITWVVFTQENRRQHTLCPWGHCTSWLHGLYH